VLTKLADGLRAVGIDADLTQDVAGAARWRAALVRRGGARACGRSGGPAPMKESFAAANADVVWIRGSVSSPRLTAWAFAAANNAALLAFSRDHE
jgi:hypothetical protein